MTNFEKITASPEALGEFLASLPVATGPWEEEFHRAFCDSCKRENCDGKRCPHQDKRNNPLWWLMLGGKEGEVPGLAVRIKAAFPVLWCKEYYTVEEKVKETRAPCVCCDNTGKVTIKGVEYPCPRCKGNWREKEVIGETTVYSIAKWMLNRIEISSTQTVTIELMKIAQTYRAYNKYSGEYAAARAIQEIQSSTRPALEVAAGGQTSSGTKMEMHFHIEAGASPETVSAWQDYANRGELKATVLEIMEEADADRERRVMR